ncbi:hypothetical protein BH23GEM6_BH23GEM6_21320 [soil metagenome]
MTQGEVSTSAIAGLVLIMRILALQLQWRITRRRLRVRAALVAAARGGTQDPDTGAWEAGEVESSLSIRLSIDGEREVHLDLLQVETT